MLSKPKIIILYYDLELINESVFYLSTLSSQPLATINPFSVSALLLLDISYK